MKNLEKLYLLFLLFLLIYLIPINIDINFTRGVLSFLVSGLIHDKVFDVKYIYFSSKKEKEGE